MTCTGLQPSWLGPPSVGRPHLDANVVQVRSLSLSLCAWLCFRPGALQDFLEEFRRVVGRRTGYVAWIRRRYKRKPLWDCLRSGPEANKSEQKVIALSQSKCLWLGHSKSCVAISFFRELGPLHASFAEPCFTSPNKKFRRIKLS